MFGIDDEKYGERMAEIRKALGLNLDAPHGYVIDAIHHLRFRPGTSVRTLVALHDKDYNDEGLVARKWGVEGRIVGHHDSHGLCFDVKHGRTVGTYDPDEIEVVP